MKSVTALAGLLTLGLALPATAADTFYVVQDVKTKKCPIVERKPVVHEYTVVGGDGVVYKTRAEAEGAMKITRVCTVE